MKPNLIAEFHDGREPLSTPIAVLLRRERSRAAPRQGGATLLFQINVAPRPRPQLSPRWLWRRRSMFTHILIPSNGSVLAGKGVAHGLELPRQLHQPKGTLRAILGALQPSLTSRPSTAKPPGSSNVSPGLFFVAGTIILLPLREPR